MYRADYDICFLVVYMYQRLGSHKCTAIRDEGLDELDLRWIPPIFRLEETSSRIYIGRLFGILTSYFISRGEVLTNAQFSDFLLTMRYWMSKEISQS